MVGPGDQDEAKPFPAMARVKAKKMMIANTGTDNEQW
jgi:hypothetical protein